MTVKVCLWALALVLLARIGRCQNGDYSYADYDYDYDDEDDYYEIDQCNFYETEHAGNCQHASFPNETLQMVFNPNVRTCCGDKHAYLFFDNCEVRKK